MLVAWYALISIDCISGNSARKGWMQKRLPGLDEEMKENKEGPGFKDVYVWNKRLRSKSESLWTINVIRTQPWNKDQI